MTKNTLAILPLLSVLTILIGGCAERLIPIDTPQDKLKAVSTALLIECKGNFSEEQTKAIWDREFPGQAVYPYLSSRKGKELAEILKQWEGEDCKLDTSNELLTPAVKLKIEELTN